MGLGGGWGFGGCCWWCGAWGRGGRHGGRGCRGDVRGRRRLFRRGGGGGGVVGGGVVGRGVVFGGGVVGGGVVAGGVVGGFVVGGGVVAGGVVGGLVVGGGVVGLVFGAATAGRPGSRRRTGTTRRWTPSPRHRSSGRAPSCRRRCTSRRGGPWSNCCPRQRRSCRRGAASSGRPTGCAWCSTGPSPPGPGSCPRSGTPRTSGRSSRTGPDPRPPRRTGRPAGRARTAPPCARSGWRPFHRRCRRCPPSGLSCCSVASRTLSISASWSALSRLSFSRSASNRL